MSRSPIDPRVFTSNGEEVEITLTCLQCHAMKPLKEFGLRRMGDGKVRSISTCKECRGKPSEKPSKIYANPLTIAAAREELLRRGIHVDRGVHSCPKCRQQWIGGLTNSLGWCEHCYDTDARLAEDPPVAREVVERHVPPSVAAQLRDPRSKASRAMDRLTSPRSKRSSD